jgi:hypothetical protein
MAFDSPIIPSPALVDEWMADKSSTYRDVLIRAVRWGSDQELELCCAATELAGGTKDGPMHAAVLRDLRRPKQADLKQQAMDALYAIASGANDMREQTQDFDTIRQALELIPDV